MQTWLHRQPFQEGSLGREPVWWLEGSVPSREGFCLPDGVYCWCQRCWWVLGFHPALASQLPPTPSPRRPAGKGRATRADTQAYSPQCRQPRGQSRALCGRPTNAGRMRVSQVDKALASERGCPGLTVGSPISLGEETDLGSDPNSATSYVVTQSLGLLLGDMLRTVSVGPETGWGPRAGVAVDGEAAMVGSWVGRSLDRQDPPEFGKGGAPGQNSAQELARNPEIDGCCPNQCN